MIYEYTCSNDKCQHMFDVQKTVAEVSRPEPCPQCGTADARRIYNPWYVHGSAGDWDKAEYNPAFGQVVRNRQHRAELAKRRGMEEIGNESVDKVHKHFDQTREDKRKQGWDKI